MDKVFKPDAFSAHPNDVDAPLVWGHWKRRFNKYMDSIKDLEDGDRIEVLINMVSPTSASYGVTRSTNAHVHSATSDHGNTNDEHQDQSSDIDTPTLAVTTRTCFFCGQTWHPRSRYGARNSSCRHCVHFATVCKSRLQKKEIECAGYR
ncbi:hypothetical protein GJ496_011189 [Pomphorhynchus laevis]|nr:hypothetical protein GJ496_011189 [Pomphorhynchus laevis]